MANFVITTVDGGTHSFTSSQSQPAQALEALTDQVVNGETFVKTSDAAIAVKAISSVKPE